MISLSYIREGFAGPSTQTCDDSRELCQEQAQGRIEAQRFYASRNGHSFSVLRRAPKVFTQAKSNGTEFPDNNHSNREAKRPNKGQSRQPAPKDSLDRRFSSAEDA
jgi:hypothetical protein